MLSRRSLFAVVLFAAACAGPRTAGPGAGSSGVGLKPVAPQLPPRDERPRELARLRMAATGDVLPHVAVKQSAQLHDAKDAQGASTNNSGYDALFAPVAPELAGLDYAIANLETPVSPSGDGGTKEFHFNAPPPLLPALLRAGINLATFANNHVYDQGRQGLSETLDELTKASLLQAGAGRNRAESRKGLRLEKSGIKLALLASTQFFNTKDGDGIAAESPQSASIDDGQELEAAVKAARQEADFVIVALHWGEEYQSAPRPVEVELAHRLFEGGADLILGTHPHVLQPIELYQASDGRLCAVVYSLGNFVSNQNRHYAFGVSPEKVGDTRDGALLRWSVVLRDYGQGGRRAELAELSYLPLWTENDFLTRKPGALADIAVVSIPRELAAAYARLDELAARSPLSKEDKLSIVGLRKRIALLERRREIIEARLGTDFAAPHAPPPPRPALPLAPPPAPK